MIIRSYNFFGQQTRVTATLTYTELTRINDYRLKTTIVIFGENFSYLSDDNKVSLFPYDDS